MNSSDLIVTLFYQLRPKLPLQLPHVSYVGRAFGFPVDRSACPVSPAIASLLFHRQIIYQFLATKFCFYAGSTC
jgi:hypothetical protein